MSIQQQPICGGASHLCSVFQQTSLDTWSRISEANRLELRYGEETVTDSVLLELMLKCPTEIHCVAYKKWQEAKNGADWEFWFTAGGRGIGCRVQAKRLYVDGNYRALTLRSRSGQLTQAETLIASAAEDGQVPLHVFFTFPTQAMGKPPSPLSGCLVAHSSKVVKLGHYHFRNVAAISKPWHEIVCICPPVRDKLSRICDNLQALCPPSGASIEIMRLPDYVQEAAWALEERRTGERPRHDRASSGARPKASVRGVVVVRVGDE